MRELTDPDITALRPVVARACRRLKVFPLPEAVVLPGTPTPLHIFEPRYRAMVADALASDRVIAVASVQEGSEPAGEGAADVPPLLHPVAGVGLIEAEERLPDGRYHLVLRGVARVRLREELTLGKPYREFEAELLDDVYPAGGVTTLEARRSALRECTLRLAKVLPAESGAPRLAEIAARLESPSQLADVIAAAVVSDHADRLKVMSELDVGKRLDLVTGEVAGVVLMLSGARAPRA